MSGISFLPFLSMLLYLITRRSSLCSFFPFELVTFYSILFCSITFYFIPFCSTAMYWVLAQCKGFCWMLQKKLLRMCVCVGGAMHTRVFWGIVFRISLYLTKFPHFLYPSLEILRRKSQVNLKYYRIRLYLESIGTSSEFRRIQGFKPFVFLCPSFFRDHIYWQCKYKVNWDTLKSFFEIWKLSCNKTTRWIKTTSAFRFLNHRWLWCVPWHLFVNWEPVILGIMCSWEPV